MATVAGQDDLVAALDTPFNDPAVESKFNALKKLQFLKVKSLMTSLDAIKKENEKLKALGKDSRRTQMIQNLRVKVKNQEVMNDVLKDLLVIEVDETKEEDDLEEPKDTRRKFYSRQEVNKFLSDKSAGAPKRFRPKTREEIENELAKYQKENEKLKKSLLQQQRAVSASSDAKVSAPASRVESKSQPRAESKAAIRNETGSKETDKLIESMKIIKLKDEISSLEVDLETKEDEIVNYKQEIADLRTSLGSCTADEEILRCKQKLYEEMQNMYQKTSDELNDTSTALVLARGEVVQTRAQADAEIEALKATIDRLNNSLEKSMKQNKSLLSEVHKAERLNISAPSLTNPIPSRPTPSSASAASSVLVSEPVTAATSVPSSSPSQEDRKALTSKETKVYEQKITNLRQKLADSESKLRDLQEEPKKVASLMEELRSKNEVIRELKRDLSEMSRPSRNNNSDKGESNNRDGGNVISEELVGNLYDEVKRLKSEIDRLKQQRSSAPSPKRAISDSNGSDSLQGRVVALEQENKDLIDELSDVNSRLDKTGGLSDAAKLANTLVEGFKNVLIDIHDKVILDSQSHALDAMSDCKIEGEIMVKVDDPSIDRDKLIELLEVFEFFFEEHGGGGNSGSGGKDDKAAGESKSQFEEGVPGSPFNT